MKKLLTLPVLLLVLSACGSPAANPTPAPTHVSVAGTWSGDLTPDGGAPQTINLHLIGGQDGNFSGYATPYGKNLPQYPLSGNSRTGVTTIQFVFGTTITLRGPLNRFVYQGTYTTSTGDTGTFDISRDIR